MAQSRDYQASTSPGKLCIEVTPASKLATISEDLCIGCGICVKVGGGVRVGFGEGGWVSGAW